MAAAETLAALIHDLTYRGKQVSTGTSRAIADSILRSDWLAEQIAAAEKRGAVNALREAAEACDAHAWWRPFFAGWLCDRADQIGADR